MSLCNVWFLLEDCSWVLAISQILAEVGSWVVVLFLGEIQEKVLIVFCEVGLVFEYFKLVDVENLQLVDIFEVGWEVIVCVVVCVGDVCLIDNWVIYLGQFWVYFKKVGGEDFGV